MFWRIGKKARNELGTGRATFNCKGQIRVLVFLIGWGQIWWVTDYCPKPATFHWSKHISFQDLYLDTIIHGIESGRLDGLGIQINGSDLSSFGGEMNGDYTGATTYLQNAPCNLWKMVYHQP